MEGLAFVMWFPMVLIGLMLGVGMNSDEIRNKVVTYCIEKPQLCKEEYQNIKTQTKLNTYQKPEIK